MQVKEERIVIDSTWFSAEREVSRSKGLHLSHVLDFIEKQEGKIRDGGKLSDIGNNYACGGFLWERVLEKLIELDPADLYAWLFGRAMVDVENPQIIRPGELCLNGIYMTPDGYNFETEMLEEWKYTTKSPKGGITGPKFKRWVWWQIPCYLMALHLTACRLRVYFSHGDWTTHEPFWIQYDLLYGQQEIDEVWDSVRLHAKYMIDNGLVKKNQT